MRLPRQLISYGVGEAFAKGLNILLTLVLARLLTTEFYGVVCLLISVELVITEIVVMGQHTVILRLYEKHKKNISNVYRASLYIMAAAAAMILICDGFGLFDNFEELYGIKTEWVFPLLIGAVYVNSNIIIFLAYLRMANDVAMYNLLRVMFQLVKLIAVIGLCSYLGDYIAYPVGLLLAAVTVLITFFRKIDNETGVYRNILSNRKNLIENVRIGFPLAVHTTIGTVYSQIDRFMVGGLMSESDVGIYNYSLTIGTSIFFLINVLALYFVPKIYGQANIKDAKNILNKFFVASVISALILGLIVYFVVYPIASHWVSEDFKRGDGVVIFGILSVIVHPLSLYGLYGMTYMKEVKIVPFITGFALMINYSLSSTLIPLYGLNGAACSVFLSELIYGIIILIMYMKKLQRSNDLLSV